jgi:transcriptional regulator with XRE-family HTH domain
MSHRLTEVCNGKNEFGIIVVKRLYVLGKTQQWLAQQCGVSKQYISQIIHGKSKPSAEVTERIAALFAMDVKELREKVLQAS